MYKRQVPYLVIGWDVLWKAIRNIAHGQVFDENFLMALATVGAFGTGEFPEAVAVMLFYQVGEWFQGYAAVSYTHLAERFGGKGRRRRMETAKQLLSQRIGFLAVDILAEKSVNPRQ